MKLWDKNISTEDRILAFTTGKDPIYDLQLAPYDVIGIHGAYHHACRG